MAIMTQAQWLQYHRDHGTTPTGTYAQYVAAHTNPPPTPKPPGGPAPSPTASRPAAAAAAPIDQPAPAPVAVPAPPSPPPAPVPGTLDAAGQQDLSALTQWNALQEADIQAALDRNRLLFEDNTRRAGTGRDENMRRNTNSFAARGLIRSGLRAGGEAKVVGNYVDTLSALNRQWGDQTADAERARKKLAATFGERKTAAERAAYDRLMAEWRAAGGTM